MAQHADTEQRELAVIFDDLNASFAPKSLDNTTECIQHDLRPIGEFRHDR